MSKLIPLNDTQLRAKAPSIFAESAIDNISSYFILKASCPLS